VLSDSFTLVDNTAEPDIIFVKDSAGERKHPNRYWTLEAIARLIKGTALP
jgi:hypothetical protein